MTSQPEGKSERGKMRNCKVDKNVNIDVTSFLVEGKIILKLVS